MKNLSSILVLLVALTCTNLKTVYAYDGAEVFDIQKGEIVKLITNSEILQRDVGKWLDSITGPVGSLKIEPDSGIGVKIVLTPPQNVKNQWINGTVTEVVLLISRTETYYPTLLVFTKENSVVAVNIHCDLMKFLKMNNLYDPELNLKSPNPILGLDQLKSATDFKLFIPHYSIKSWKLEIKEPYPLDTDRLIKKVRLHYFDKSGSTYMFGIEQHKAIGYKSKRSETIIDVRSHTMTTKVIEENFRFDTSGEIVKLNGIEARFAYGALGGCLRWVQDGTYIEMDSFRLSRKQMVIIAKSMA